MTKVDLGVILPLKLANGNEMRLSQSQDHRPDGISDRVWRMMQIVAIKREMDKMLLADIISFVSLSRAALISPPLST